MLIWFWFVTCSCHVLSHVNLQSHGHWYCQIVIRFIYELFETDQYIHTITKLEVLIKIQIWQMHNVYWCNHFKHIYVSYILNHMYVYVVLFFLYFSYMWRNYAMLNSVVENICKMPSTVSTFKGNTQPRLMLWTDRMHTSVRQCWLMINSNAILIGPYLVRLAPRICTCL